MRLVFFGSGAFGIPTLRRLRERHEVAAIVTRPDRPAGRGGRLSPTPVAAASKELPPGFLLRPEDVNGPDVVRRIRDLHADAWVVVAYGQKLGRALLEGAPAVNLHASRLPRWRGAAPVNWAILAGDTETGNSVILLAERMDAGDVLARTRRSIEPTMTAGELHDLLAADGPDLVEYVLAGIEAGTAVRTPQDESLVTLASRLTRADAWIDFRQDAEACRRRINGLSPWPGIEVRLEAGALRLLRAQAEGEVSQGVFEPGCVLAPARGVVACGGGTCLRLLDVQPAGGRVMAWDEFARGRRIRTGEPVLSAVPPPDGQAC